MIKLNVHKTLSLSGNKIKFSIDISLREGLFYTLYGSSGAGKTTVLRMLAGITQPTEGKIEVNGKKWFDSTSRINLKPQERNIGFVFQDYALFPNMTVRENLLFALNNKKDDSIIDELIEIMELGDFQNRKPKTLSGGQQQRTALARALVQKPKILLLDEPLSALDRDTRFKLQDYIRTIHQKFNLTTILVSHDIGEIIKLSDYVFELKNGCVIRQGTPNELFVSKKLSGKFQFIGEILHIEKQEIIYIVTVLIQNNIVKVIAQEEEIHSLKVGEKIIVASKAFNPTLQKIKYLPQ